MSLKLDRANCEILRAASINFAPSVAVTTLLIVPRQSRPVYRSFVPTMNAPHRYHPWKSRGWHRRSTIEDYEVLLDATTEHFVLRVKDIKYCPHPDCVGVVKFNPLECRHNLEIRDDGLETVGAVCTASGEHGNDAPLTYEGVGDPAYYQSTSSVQPKTAHRFCFHCGSTDIHWPIPCQKLVEWKEEVKRQVGEVAGGDGDDENYNDVAQKLWMKANTRPCPKVVANWRCQKVFI
jgi:hypothetical protein